jgi:hypothetical protein
VARVFQIVKKILPSVVGITGLMSDGIADGGTPSTNHAQSVRVDLGRVT